MLDKFNNYGPYVDLVVNPGNTLKIQTSSITNENWLLHFNSIMNILKDGIEAMPVQEKFINVDFGNGVDVDLTIPDYVINLILWRPIIYIDKIEPQYLFFEDAMTRKGIKAFIDNNIIEPNRGKISNVTINNLIDDVLSPFKFIDDFSLYFANTIGLEDDIKLMMDNEEVREIFNVSLADVPISEVNGRAMDLTNKLIGYIIADDHCMKHYFLTGEGIKPKQYKEYAVNVGPKPDGKGGIIPSIIDNSFINGGLQSPTDYYVESSAGRIAQILSKNNVGDSGHFARLLGLNNSDTFLHHNPNYSCDTRNFEEIVIRNKEMLKKLKHRYYRLVPNGVEMIIKPKEDGHLIGQMIYLRSPITCASHARGEGICYKCYGKLAFTNSDINPGKIATQILSAILTQILLSAKHLLEAAVKKIEWTSKFYDLFEVNTNVINLDDEVNIKDYKLVIDMESINLESEEDGFDFNEYINSFEIIDDKGKLHSIAANNMDDLKLYLTSEFNDIVRRYMKATEDKIEIPMKTIKDLSLFVVKIHNNELSKTLDKLKNIINLSRITNSFNRHQILQEFVDTVLDGKLYIDSIHCEVIISNQIRDKENILDKPKWDIPNAQYQILTLHRSLLNHPSLVVTMSYQDLARQLYNPLTFAKRKSSLMDVYFHEEPHNYVDKALKYSEEGK